jgi:hypothetical protein
MASPTTSLAQPIHLIALSYDHYHHLDHKHQQKPTQIITDTSKRAHNRKCPLTVLNHFHHPNKIPPETLPI